jgi:REP element-mobilizing transposase RayT
MREPYTQLFLHVVWATWDRLPLLTPALVQPVYAGIQAQCVELKCRAIAIGGIEDHVHLLVRFPATISVAQLVKQAKGSSSHLITHELAPESGFKWQGYYGAFTLSKAEVSRVREYILRQREHHTRGDLDFVWELADEYLDEV